MTVRELKEQIEAFYKKVKSYRSLLVESRNPHIPEIEKNQEKIKESRKILIRKYAKLEPYIKKLGKNPKMCDGVWKIWYSPYDNAFSSDILLRVGPSIDAVIDDLDLIIGKLENMKAEKEIEMPQSPKESIKKRQPIEEEKLLNRIDTSINLAEQKLLKGEELNELISDLKRFKVSADKDEITKRKLEKIQREPNTVWSDPKGYAVGGVELLRRWREIFLGLISPDKVPSQKYFRPGSREEIFSYLKPLISSAKTIKIYDNYLGEEILKLLESTSQDTEIFILGGGGKIDKRFITKLPAFIIYFGRKIEAKKTSKVAHARFYIIDDLVYHVDPSLKGGGADRATIISPVDKQEAGEIIKDFNDWWQKGENLLKS